MSEIYTLEPPTKGRVTIVTTLGPIEIDLWAKECPKACRNFVQLCLEGYYNGTEFHRVIPDFLIQGGDPTGTGTGGESIYGPESFPNEYHSRLKFRYRGLLGVATLYSEIPQKIEPTELDPLGQDSDSSLGRPFNGSQFFITLNRADGLNGKNTLFGKVTGPTIWNVTRIAELETDANDRPLEPCRILSANVEWNPFDDIVPRRLPIANTETDSQEATIVDVASLRPTLTSTHKSLLSFEDDEGGGDVEEDTSAARVRSAHDLLVDPNLSKNPVQPSLTRENGSGDIALGAEEKLAILKERVASKSSRGALIAENTQSSAQVISVPLQTLEEDEAEAENGGEARDASENEGASTKEKTSVSQEYQLREGAVVKKHGGLGTQNRIERDLLLLQDSDLMTERERRRGLVKARKGSKNRKAKEEDAMKKIFDFEKKLKSIQKQKELAMADNQHHKDAALLQDAEDDDDLDATSWLKDSSGLRFAVDSSTAYAFDAAQSVLKERSQHG